MKVATDIPDGSPHQDLSPISISYNTLNSNLSSMLNSSRPWTVETSRQPAGILNLVNLVILVPSTGVIFAKKALTSVVFPTKFTNFTKLPQIFSFLTKAHDLYCHNYKLRMFFVVKL